MFYFYFGPHPAALQRCIMIEDLEFRQSASHSLVPHCSGNAEHICCQQQQTARIAETGGAKRWNHQITCERSDTSSSVPFYKWDFFSLYRVRNSCRKKKRKKVQLFSKQKYCVLRLNNCYHVHFCQLAEQIMRCTGHLIKLILITEAIR